jgi:uncharacterized protein (DUF608 family)
MSDPIERRRFLKLSTGTAIASFGVGSHRSASAADSIGDIYQRTIPARKELDAAWAASLARRGGPMDAGITSKEKTHLHHIGMTVGGIGCGTVYLTGDGRLWVWDIFHQPHEGVVPTQVDVPAGLRNIGGAEKKVRERDGSNYVSPPSPATHPNPFQQGFTLYLEGEDKPRPMDSTGWKEVSFTGRWPLGIVEFSDEGSPVSCRLEAWTPFIPLETADSSLPVTVMEYTLRNRSASMVRGKMEGLWENPVGVFTRRRTKVDLESKRMKNDQLTLLVHRAAEVNSPDPAPRPDIVFEDFEKQSYGSWKVDGTAMGKQPMRVDQVPAYQGKTNAQGKGLLNSHASAPGASIEEKDNAKGSLESPEFEVCRHYIRLLLGGGAKAGEVGVEVLVDGRIVASATGSGNNRMREVSLEVKAFEGRKASIRIVDRVGGAWGNVGVDHIVFSDMPAARNDFTKSADFGTAALALLDRKADDDEQADRLSTHFEIPPGESLVIRFLLTWHFPNMARLPGIKETRPQYSVRFPDAAAVATDVARRMATLRDGTMAWVRTWNDSTLPQWLLDRSFLTTNTLQTSNCHVLANGRFWAWEGIGCCAGTCAHVWHYAQGVARLFPDLERNLREVTDFGVAIRPDGSIRFRAEANNMEAIDSQTGIVLRTWREHLVSADDEFLKRVWPAAKRSLEWLIRFDENGRGGLDGLLDGKQHNTLDAEWYGKVHCLCSLYLAALRAGEEMARVMQDAAFASTCSGIHKNGAIKIASLFNGEFYIQEEDPAHSKAIGVGAGCYIDQVIGQWWAHQTELGRIYDEQAIRSALHALWKYNFVPEVGGFRKVFTQGRFYAMPGEAGLIMCTWPKGGLRDDFKKHWQYAYFNECMSGFEWQAAAHMVQEGSPIENEDADRAAVLLDDASDPRSLTLRGLAIGRAVHDRYDPSRRNPYNEIECSDHYARANASYSLFLAACGFSYNGPAGQMGFAPKLNPRSFRSAFTTSAGWGSFEQKQDGNKSWSSSLELAHGHLEIKALDLPWIASHAKVTLAGRPVGFKKTKTGIRFDSSVQLSKLGGKLVIEQS